MKKLVIIISLFLMIGVIGCTVSNSQKTTKADTSTGSGNIKGEVWADNWFAMYVNGELVIEDSVPITIERSFNKETFFFQLDKPAQMAFILKDFKENDTGLEYIGSRKQQMGDGGFVAQFTNTDKNELVAFSDSTWKCLVIHNAPSDKNCEKDSNPVAGKGNCNFTITDEPEGWKNAGFDDSKWINAKEYSESAVSPKDGYNQIKWDSKAKLIWGNDLETDNTILCRAKLNP